MSECVICGIKLQGKKDICSYHQWENATDEERKPKQIKKENTKEDIRRADIGINKPPAYIVTK